MFTSATTAIRDAHAPNRSRTSDRNTIRSTLGILYYERHDSQSRPTGKRGSGGEGRFDECWQWHCRVHLSDFAG